jgi:murein DD-endopeptidase MepM/ murein hydrolase activator NlpD
MKSVLIFLIGVMVGANIVYFVMTRDGGRPVALLAPPVVTKTPAAEADAAVAAVGAPQQSPPSAAATAAAPSPQPVAPAAQVAPADIVLAPTGLAMPLPGLQPGQLTDTFAEARGSDRRHDALDIMAPAGTPVLAVADGHVEKLFTSVQGGLTLYQFEPSGRYAYYYAHLQGYAPGIAEGRQLKRGEVIGHVGSTGNANPAAPHLHFAVFLLGPEKQWWKGTPINPYPLLGGRPAAVAGQ